MPATPVHHTAVVDGAWDAGVNIGNLKMPLTTARGNAMFAWVNPDGDSTQKGPWSLPHHLVDANSGEPGAASISGVRAASARANQVKGADKDQAAIRRHLQAHMDDYNKKKGTSFDLYAEFEWEPDDEPLVESLEAVLASIEVRSHVWAIRPEVLAALARWDGQIAAGDISVDATDAARRAKVKKAAGTAVIPLKGIITPQPSFLSMLLFGAGGGLLAFRQNLMDAANDPDIGHIVMDIDSPGGMVDLVPEVAQDIRDVRKDKRCHRSRQPADRLSRLLAGSTSERHCRHAVRRDRLHRRLLHPSGHEQGAGAEGRGCQHRQGRQVQDRRQPVHAPVRRRPQPDAGGCQRLLRHVRPRRGRRPQNESALRA